MVDVYTSTATRSELVIAVYDKYIEMANRHRPQFRQIADKRPVDVTSPGETVNFKIHGELAVDTTPLSETVDVATVGMPAPTSVAVTVNEYGNAAITTRRFELASYSDVDPVLANQIAWNELQTLDALVQAKLDTVTATPVLDATAQPGGPIFKSADIRRAVTKLRAAAAEPAVGDFYAAYIHPNVAYDLREDAGPTGWATVHVGSAPDVFWDGTTGLFGGAFFIETPRVGVATPGASAVYSAYVAGKQAVVEAVSQEPGTVLGPQTDRLRRFQSIGWYGVLGWAIYRSTNIVRITSGSTID